MYIQSQVGAPAIDLVQRAPERMLWGSDWPHTLATTRPHGADLLRRLRVWAPHNDTQAQILQANPERLFAHLEPVRLGRQCGIGQQAVQSESLAKPAPLLFTGDGNEHHIVLRMKQVIDK